MQRVRASSHVEECHIRPREKGRPARKEQKRALRCACDEGWRPQRLDMEPGSARAKIRARPKTCGLRAFASEANDVHGCASQASFHLQVKSSQLSFIES